ncbi:carboxypeptidase M32 [Salisaeta longa]|uniref:carboxypeptidase M32 n=1 Tax=Salisaeta longa TaxID=503170 RepID=UPI0003B4D329|nr:carboxypeptidase M32 [Salisaeta longa]
MSDALEALRTRLAKIEDVKHAAAVLAWDQETWMPPEGESGRAQQLSTLHTLAHDLFVDDATGALLNMAEAAATQPLDADLVRVVRRDYERERTVASDLVARLSEAAARGQAAWQKARANDDFEAFAPHLERLVQLNIEKAEQLGYDDTPYDALLEEYEPGCTTATLVDTFGALRRALVPIVEHIAAAPALDASPVHGPFPKAQQRTFGEAVMADLGYDFSRGRQDESAHPFTTAFGIDDVRVTTRYDTSFFPTAFFSMLHEAGHAMYEQGLSPDLARTPLAEGASLGMHESQSRLWENMVGRSRAFWTHYFPKAQAAFPDALADTAAEAFYRAINRVEPSLIRVEADEVTYPLHVMVRFELERALIEERLTVDELPAAWNARMDEYLGVVPDSDANGVLQDVHWSMGAFGYFPTYALGTLMATQLWDAIERDIPNVRAQVAQGQTSHILEWLRTHIHRHGRRRTAEELLQDATGEGLTADPWLAYVRKKFGALYGSIPQAA